MSNTLDISDITDPLELAKALLAASPDTVVTNEPEPNYRSFFEQLVADPDWHRMIREQMDEMMRRPSAFYALHNRFVNNRQAGKTEQNTEVVQLTAGQKHKWVLHDEVEQDHYTGQPVAGVLNDRLDAMRYAYSNHQEIPSGWERLTSMGYQQQMPLENALAQTLTTL